MKKDDIEREVAEAIARLEAGTEYFFDREYLRVFRSILEHEMNTRTLDDLAREMACKTLAVVAKVLREDEQLDAFKEFHHIAVSGLEAYAIHSERLRQRFEPSKN